MGDFRILKNKNEALQCLRSLKVLFGMLDEHIIACFGTFELFFEGGNPDLFLFLDDKDSKIVDATDNMINVQYEIEGEMEIGEIRFSEIENYSNMIADVFQQDMNVIRN